ncbi:MAG TPA: 5-(carboxyamino)imidazole ribonucleotide synthase [Acidimicrobiales bacterium]|nr:5-(carboxyamino)imidazole ribonucleotide synthase [Acidimicrobiales bacterium]
MAEGAVAARVGVVGGGQLARMMGEAARSAGVSVVVLAATPDDPAVATCDEVEVGDSRDADAIDRLAQRVDVVTFDHELVDLTALESIATRVAVRPGPSALAFAVDKAHQRRALSRAGLPTPRFAVVRGVADARTELTGFADVVVKAARGGYDGRGVWFPATHAEAAAAAGDVDGEVIIEERLVLSAEAAQLVVRGVDGEIVAYPLVRTLQRDAMCVEVDFPSALGDGMVAKARDLAERLAVLTGVVGVLAVELLVAGDDLFVNELAMRPHNTGHWTIEGCATSQFVNHLRAVSGRALGSTTPTTAAAAMVNLVGAASPPASRPAGPGVFVHDYGKAWRPGRKLGHVTALGDDVDAARMRAWAEAAARGAREEPA